MFHVPTLHELGLHALFIIPTLLSLSVHEWAHAMSAWQLGDDTASMQGRLTLDPMAHVDPIGTILLPLLGIPFGWAKPVPVNPLRFDRKYSMETGMVITAMAGPASNLVLAVACAVVFGLMLRFAPAMAMQDGVRALFQFGIQINVALAIFNLLPIPPLDGSRLLERFIPYAHRHTWEAAKQYSPFLLFMVVSSGGFVLAGPITAGTEAMYELIRRIVY